MVYLSSTGFVVNFLLFPVLFSFSMTMLRDLTDAAAIYLPVTDQLILVDYIVCGKLLQDSLPPY